MRTSETDLILVPGAPPSDRHWIARWWRNLSTAKLVTPPPGVQDLSAEWHAELLAAVSACTRPRVVIGHGLGATLTAAAGNALAQMPVAGAVLVAPHDVDAAAHLGANADTAAESGFSPPGFPILCIAPRNNPHCRFARAEAMAAALEAQLVDAGDTGTLDDASGHGPWPEGLLRLGRFLKRLEATE